MSVIGQSKGKWRWPGALALIVAIAIIGVPALSQASLTIDPHVMRTSGPIRRLHGTLWTLPDTEGLTPRDRTVGGILAHSLVCQTFAAEYPDLLFVEVEFATYARANTGPVTFHLRASPDAADDLFTITFDAADVEDNVYRKFEFSPIRESAGRSFCFCLEAPEAEPGNAITVWGSTEDTYPAGEVVLEGLEDRGVRDLTFRLGYDPPLGVKAGVLLERLVANKPSLWGDKRFYILLAVAYLVLLYVLFVRVMGMRPPGEMR